MRALGRCQPPAAWPASGSKRQAREHAAKEPLASCHLAPCHSAPHAKKPLRSTKATALQLLCLAQTAAATQCQASCQVLGEQPPAPLASFFHAQLALRHQLSPRLLLKERLKPALLGKDFFLLALGTDRCVCMPPSQSRLLWTWRTRAGTC